MSEIALESTPVGRATIEPNLNQKPHASAALVFVLLLVCGVGYAAYGIVTDTPVSHWRSAPWSCSASRS